MVARFRDPAGVKDSKICAAKQHRLQADAIPFGECTSGLVITEEEVFGNSCVVEWLAEEIANDMALKMARRI